MKRILTLVLLLAGISSANAQDNRIEIPADTLTMKLGETVRIIPDTYVKGPHSIRWTSDDEGVASVYRDGAVTGLKVGETRVAVTVGRQDTILATDDIVVLVVQEAVAVLELRLPDPRLTSGTSAQLKVRAFDAMGYEQPVGSLVFDSSDRDVAWIDETGRVYAGKPGTATLWAVDGQVSGTLEITVIPAS